MGITMLWHSRCDQCCSDGPTDCRKGDLTRSIREAGWKVTATRVICPDCLEAARVRSDPTEEDKTMDEVLRTVREALDLAYDACRDGVVGATGYTDDGSPRGGHLTSDAMSCIASARHMLASVGVPWSETDVVLPS